MTDKNRNFKEEKNESKVYAGGREYYQYLKNLKNDKDNNEYSATFIMF